MVSIRFKHEEDSNPGREENQSSKRAFHSCEGLCARMEGVADVPHIQSVPFVQVTYMKALDCTELYTIPLLETSRLGDVDKAFRLQSGLGTQMGVRYVRVDGMVFEEGLLRELPVVQGGVQLLVVLLRPHFPDLCYLRYCGPNAAGLTPSVALKTYLNAAGGGDERGTRVHLWDHCESTPHSTWKLEEVPGADATNNDQRTYFVRNAGSNLCLNIVGGSTNPNSAVHLWDDCVESLHSQWEVIYLPGTNHIALRSAHTGGLLEMTPGECRTRDVGIAGNAINGRLASDPAFVCVRWQYSNASLPTLAEERQDVMEVGDEETWGD